MNKHRGKRRKATKTIKLTELFLAGLVLGGVASSKTTTTSTFPARVPSSIHAEEASSQYQEQDISATAQASTQFSDGASTIPANLWSDAASGGGGESDDGGGTEDEDADVDEASSSDFEPGDNAWFSLQQKKPKEPSQPHPQSNSQPATLLNMHTETRPSVQMLGTISAETEDTKIKSDDTLEGDMRADTGHDDRRDLPRTDENNRYDGDPRTLKTSAFPSGEESQSISPGNLKQSLSSRTEPQHSRQQPYQRATRIPTKDTSPIGSQPLQTLEKLQQMLDETDYMTASNSRQTTTRTHPIPHNDQPSTPITNHQQVPQSEKLWTSKDRAKYKKQQQRLRQAEQEHTNAPVAKATENWNNGSSRMKFPPLTRQNPTFQGPNTFSATSIEDEEDYSDDTTDDGWGYSLPDLPVYYSDAEDEGETSAADEDTLSSAASVQGPQLQQKVSGPHHHSPYQNAQQYHSSFQTAQQQGRHPSSTQGIHPLPPHQPANVPMGTQGAVSSTGSASSSYTPPQQHYPPYYGPQNSISPEQQYLVMQQRQNQYTPFAPPGPYVRQQHRQQSFVPYNAYPPLPIPPNNHPQNGYQVPYQYPPSYYATAQQQAYAEQYAAWATAMGYAAQVQYDQSEGVAGYAQQPPARPGAHASYPATSFHSLASLPSKVEPSGTSSTIPLKKNMQHEVDLEFKSSAANRSHPKNAVFTDPRRPFPSPNHVVASTEALLPKALVSPFPIIRSQPNVWLTPSPHMDFSDERGNHAQSLVEASSRLSFDSIQKISLLLVTVGLLSYSAVSPRTLPLTEYNLKFYENLQVACLATLAPAIYMLFVFDARENDINSVTNSFFYSFTLGYLATFVVEILATTILRLAVFYIFERDLFCLTPRVPVPLLPWVLREKKYLPKRITLFAADFGTSCIICPIIEECVKLLLLRWTTSLPRNFNWVTKTSTKRKRKRRVAEAVVRQPGEGDCLNANQYVTHMLAVSLGLKLSDAGRRILLYTKDRHANKRFYAICRGIFPIQELCGAMTSLAMAKRDLLGFDIPLWKMLAPAVVVHGMANFRGMKPIFKWNSATPWSEMQLSPLNVPDASTFPQLVKKGYAKLMWAVVLSRVLGYCVKNYFMVNRQAVKRTTKYAGNHAAFSAELATAEMLRNQKN